MVKIARQNVGLPRRGGGEEKGWAALTPDLAVVAHRAYILEPRFFTSVGTILPPVKKWFLTTRSYAPLLSPVGGPCICSTLSFDRCLNKLYCEKSAVKNSFEVVKNVQLSGLLKRKQAAIKQANFSLESKSFYQ